MKTARRLWLAWLALPEAIRIMVVIALAVFIGMLLPRGVGAIEVEMVAHNGGDVVRLQDRPCVHAGTLAFIKPEFRDKFRMARAMIGGHDWFGCFIVSPAGVVVIIFEDGDQAEIPIAAFKLDDGA